MSLTTLDRTRPAVAAAERARLLAADPDRWLPAVHFDPAARVHTRIAADDDFEAWLLTWLPGQGTDIHDHGGSAGALVVLSGVLSEWTPSGLRRGGRTRRLRTGALRPFGPDHIHRVRNDALEPAISLHVYAPRLRTMTRYDLLDGQLRTLGTDRAGADW